MTSISEAVPTGAQHVSATRPYAWPWDGVIDIDTLALIVVQAPDSVESETLGPTGDWQHRSASLAEHVSAARSESGPATVIQLITHPPLLGRENSAHQGTDPQRFEHQHTDTRLHALGLGDTTSTVVVHSAGWNGFFGSSLDSVLRQRGIKNILLTGYWLEVGVHSTMRSANDRGYECLLVEDAVRSRDPELTGAALSTIQMSGGIFGAVGESQAVIDALAKGKL